MNVKNWEECCHHVDVYHAVPPFCHFAKHEDAVSCSNLVTSWSLHTFSWQYSTHGSLQEQQEVQKLMNMKQELGEAEERLEHGRGLAKTQQGLTDYSQDFFGKPTFLTVSGQLNAEIYATALSDVYTFGGSSP